MNRDNIKRHNNRYQREIFNIVILVARVGQYTDFLVIPQYHFLILTRILNTEIPYLGIYSYLRDLLCIYIYFEFLINWC